MLKIAVAVKGTVDHPHAGGLLWMFLNWALGLRDVGCEVVWIEELPGARTPEAYREMIERTQRQLAPFGLGDRLCVVWRDGSDARSAVPSARLVALDDAVDADLLVNFKYDLAAPLVARFRRSALVDVDPVLLQRWIARGQVETAPHDTWFTTGETVPAFAPQLGLTHPWQYVPPCVHLDSWPAQDARPQTSFTTIVHWWANAWTGDGENEKRHGFYPYLDLAAGAAAPLELATDIPDGDGEADDLRRRGWRVSSAAAVAATPETYRSYVQSSIGEFSCAKPAYVREQCAWISERTLNYLASGRPAVVEHTGPSAFLPEAAGLFRFRTPGEARAHLETAFDDYPRQSANARALAVERFDARRSAAFVLEQALA